MEQDSSLSLSSAVQHANDMKSVNTRIMSFVNGLDKDKMEELAMEMAGRLYDRDPEAFEEAMDVAEGLTMYNNYVSETEAKTVVSKFQNYDNTRGAKWSPDTFFGKVKELGVEKEKEGKFNCWALYTVANMIYSDCGATLSNYASGNDFVVLVYSLATNFLEDADMPRKVRWYFGL